MSHSANPGIAIPAPPAITNGSIGYFLFLSESLTTILLQLSEVLLLVSGVVLVVGLYFENKSPFWHPKAELFALLVLIGCGGELIADGGVVIFSEHLQKIEKTRISDLAAQAGEAASKALLAKETADSANSVAGIAKGKADAAQGEADAAERDAGFAQQSASDALASAMKLRDELAYEDLVLAAKAYDINFEPYMFNQLNPKVLRVVKVASSCSGASILLAQNLVKVLKTRGWSVPDAPVPSCIGSGGMRNGVTVFNKWISLDTDSLETVDETTVDPISSRIKFSKDPGAGWPLARQFSLFTLAFGGRLEEDANLGDKDIIITVGEPKIKRP